MTSAGDVNTRDGNPTFRMLPRQSNSRPFQKYERPVPTMSTCNHNCPMFSTERAQKIEDTLAEVATMVARIDEHVTIYLGNSRPGMIPEQITSLQNQVDEHETYIQQQKGAGKVGHYLWTALLALCAAVIGAFGKGWFK